MEVPCEKIEDYLQKWGHIDPDQLSIEENMRRDLDDPLKMNAIGKLLVNGKEAPRRTVSSLIWNPKTENSWTARRTLEHYGLDREKGYLLRREAFLRKSTNPAIRNMDLILSAEPVSIPGERFIAPKNGETMTFTHPVSGKIHSLTVIAQTREALNPNFLKNSPCCYTRLSFTLDPQLNRDLFSIVDCDPGDNRNGIVNVPNSASLTGKIPSTGHSAMSSLRFAPAEQITWRMVFRQKTRPDVTVPLLP
jgi:hypothetical protein